VLDALDRVGRNYQIRYSCPSLAGLTAAVTAGLAVTVLSQSTLPAGLRQIGADEGFPDLYTNEIQLSTSPGPDSSAVTSMREHIINWFATGGQVAA
jgi:DNA-binding transcriptional LysR family regulator